MNRGQVLQVVNKFKALHLLAQVSGCQKRPICAERFKSASTVAVSKYASIQNQDGYRKSSHFPVAVDPQNNKAEKLGNTTKAH
jgi:hypothetical protein